MAGPSHQGQARTRIKICGVRDAESAMAAVDAGADAVGFVFVDKSPRHVPFEDARRVVERLPAFVEPVALFADAPLTVVLGILNATGIRTVQLHGQETEEFIDLLRGFRVIRAMNFGDARKSSWHSSSASSAPSNVVALLVDSPAKPQAALTGGGGEPFDWSLLSSLDRAMLPPLILAGGLTAENVGEAITTVRPYAVDVSSGVESSRGVKDAEKIRAFCAAVRRADGLRG